MSIINITVIFIIKFFKIVNIQNKYRQRQPFINGGQFFLIVCSQAALKRLSTLKASVTLKNII